jgi:hypothetical protein
VRTSASSRLIRARKDSFCHIGKFHDSVTFDASSRVALTDKRAGDLIEAYSNIACDA